MCTLASSLHDLPTASAWPTNCIYVHGEESGRHIASNGSIQNHTHHGSSIGLLNSVGILLEANLNSYSYEENSFRRSSPFFIKQFNSTILQWNYFGKQESVPVTLHMLHILPVFTSYHCSEFIEYTKWNHNESNSLAHVLCKSNTVQTAFLNLNFQTSFAYIHATCILYQNGTKTVAHWHETNTVYKPGAHLE